MTDSYRRVVTATIALMGTNLAVFALTASGMWNSASAQDPTDPIDLARDTCTTTVQDQCTTCAGSGNGYQCVPAALTTGYVYGSCIDGNGTCNGRLSPGTGVGTINCGSTDWNCATPPVSTAAGTGGYGNSPRGCKS